MQSPQRGMRLATMMQVDDLQQQLDTTQDELKDLQAQVNLSNERLQRASKLTAALGEESIRWEDTAKQISANMSLLVGDVFLGSALINYCGGFTARAHRSWPCPSDKDSSTELSLPDCCDVPFLGSLP